MNGSIGESDNSEAAKTSVRDLLRFSSFPPRRAATSLMVMPWNDLSVSSARSNPNLRVCEGEPGMHGGTPLGPRNEKIDQQTVSPLGVIRLHWRSLPRRRVKSPTGLGAPEEQLGSDGDIGPRGPESRLTI